MTCAGFSANFLDITPAYAGILYSVSNTIATIPGILSPIITQYILHPDGNAAAEAPASRWRIVFYVAAAVNIGALAIYLIFAKAKPVAKLN